MSSEITKTEILSEITDSQTDNTSLDSQETSLQHHHWIAAAHIKTVVRNGTAVGRKLRSNNINDPYLKTLKLVYQEVMSLATKTAGGESSYKQHHHM